MPLESKKRTWLPSTRVILSIALLAFGVFLIIQQTQLETSICAFCTKGTTAEVVGLSDLRRMSRSRSLAALALKKVLQDASPIFGHYDSTNANFWMAKYDDATKIVHMNIPGTHDAATWNYSTATQQSLKHVTDLVEDTDFPAAFLRYHYRSIVEMLNAGIRAFDLRYAQDVTGTGLVFWHGRGLQSETATVDDVLYGFYHWLDDHPSEALFLSFQYEGSASMRNIDSAQVQMQLFDTLTSPAAQQYIVQTRGSLGTLGEARGKITLLRRFDLNKLPPSHEASMPGLHFSPSKWTVNSARTTLVYNDTTSAAAYIEDYYEPLTAFESTAETNIGEKLDATVAHLRSAASNEHPDSLYWAFASSTKTNNEPPLTPQILALGDDAIDGVNQLLVSVLEPLKGQRLGMVMFDFFEQPEGLLDLFLDLLPPAQALALGT